MRRGTTCLLSGAVVLLLAACGPDGGTDGGTGPTSAAATSESTPSPDPTMDEPTTETPTDDPTDSGPAFPDDTAPQTAENSGEWDLVLADVRVGEHQTYDRIVLEFTGTGVPGWTVNYVDEAVLDGSGEVVTLGGDAILDIYASGTTYPESGEDSYNGPRQFEPDDGGDIDEVHVAGTFEGYTQVLAGLEGDRVPFRVFALSGPPRLVIDLVD